VASLIDMRKFAGRKCGYLEIAEELIAAINSGRLPINSNLPTSRALAANLNVSRDTIVHCYEHLKSLGWIESHGKLGMYVTGAPEASKDTERDQVFDQNRLSNYGAGLLLDKGFDIGTRLTGYEPLLYGVVPQASRPAARWRKAMQNYSSASPSRHYGYVEHVLGRPELRAALASYICLSRGVICSQNEVVIFNGSFNAMSLIGRLFLEPGEAMSIEDPGFGGAKSVAAYLGLNIVAIPVDDDGLSVAALERSPVPIKLVYVMPNQQEPTGITMSVARRKQLLTWAQKNKALIIEDDHDGMFRYGKDLPPTLKSMDTQDNVIYLASFWQVLYPLTTICFAVVPPSMCEVLNSAKIHTASLTEDQPQLALAELLQMGYLQRHISKLERDIAPRRRALIYELKRAFASSVEVPLHSGGLKIMVQFNGFSDTQLLEAARQADLAAASTAAFYSQNIDRAEGEILIYFADLDESNFRTFDSSRSAK
jgi:GntR family transcriptional regulator / MocR family aminotransferase